MTKEKLRKIAHCLSGGLILLHSWERYDAGHSTYLMFLVVGVVFLSIAVFHHTFSKMFPKIDTTFFALESLLSFIIAYEYMHNGKQGLPFAYAIAGVLQIAAIFVFVNKSKGLKKR